MGRGLEGRIAVVTGSAAGIGRAYAERLAADGALVVVADIADGTATVEAIEASGGEASAIPCDVSDPEGVSQFIDAVLGTHGHLDILVNNAGIYPYEPVDAIEYATWRRVLAVNLDGTFLMSRSAIAPMREQSWGRIINITSDTFWYGSPMMAHYVASKAGVIGLTRAMATELGPFGITVNAISPGLVRTDHTASGPQAAGFELAAQQQAIHRVQEPQDLVGTVSFLCSQDAAFITGQTLNVNGGRVKN